MSFSKLAAIAARVAAGPAPGSSAPAVQLQGPFKKGNPDHEAEVDCPFGFVGAFVPLLIESWGESPDDPEMQAMASGPNPDLLVGYEMEHERFTPGRKSTDWYTPDDEDEYEMEVVVTHIAGYELSPADKATINKTVLPKLLHESVENRHFEKARDRGPDYDYEPDYD